jgi:protein SCO1/2
MPRPKFLIALVCLALAAGLVGAVIVTRPDTAAQASSGKALVGGPFQLVDQNGRKVDETLLKGKWSAVFFGYTYCPDVCPTNLQTIAAAEDRLGPKAKDLQVIFVSIDPERDTPAQLKSFLGGHGFPKGVIGLTGTQEEVATAAKAYKVYYAKTGDGSDYLMDHSTATYLMNPKGEFDRVIPYALTPDQVADQIRTAMRGS